MAEAEVSLIGHADAERRFLRACQASRLHHGWIVQGPSGIGKSLFVKSLAARLLGIGDRLSSSDTQRIPPITSLGHPDLKWIKREPNEKGVLRQDITVEQIRELNHFFALKPAMAGWRVGVVDCLDEMNLHGYNALLKTLEEPPARAILFLISHKSVPVLATIRSRCQILRLHTLSDSETETVLSQFPEQARLASQLARGRPGYGLSLAESGAAKALQAADTLLKSISRPKTGALDDVLQSVITNQANLDAFSDHVLDWTARQAEDKPGLAGTWLTLHRIKSQARLLNLSPAQTAGKLIATLQKGLKMTADQALNANI